ncbi:MAG: zinc ABC transporter substrate-binding protein [Candidatus Bathyarchaeia archaeon]
MLFKKAISAITVVIVLVVLAIFSTSNTFARPDDKIRVVVSIDILGAIISPIVNGVGVVYSIVSEGTEPHSFTLTPNTVNMALDSDLIVVTGHMGWENDLVRRVAEEKRAHTDLISISLLSLTGIRILSLNGERNIHGFWLLPDNALVIAKAVRDKLSELKPEYAQKLSENYAAFERDIYSLKIFLSNLSEKYNLSSRSVAIGFYAEHYIAEAFGLKVDSILIGEEEAVRPESLRKIYEGFRSGRYACIIVSDTALLIKSVKDALREISTETGCPVAYVIAISTSGVKKYDAIMYYNAGQVYSALLSKHEMVSSGVNIYLLTTVVSLLVIIFETALLVKGRIKL